MKRLSTAIVVGALVSSSLAIGVTTRAGAAPPAACANRDNNTHAKLLECVTLEGVRAHQAAFQAIADANADPFYPDTRAAGTEGYADSVEYVAGLMRAAGYTVTLDPVPFTFFFPVFLQQLTPVNAVYESGAFSGSGSGRVEGGQVIPVDINLTPPRANSSGCEASDFAGLDFSGPDDIALIQRGTCTFGEKAFQAQAAGAEAVIIFNQGNADTPDRTGLIVGNATTRNDGTPVQHSIPVVGASFAQGEALAQPGSTATVDARFETRTDFNVIAEMPGKNTNNVVMVGAHLDSVTEGPGINDNGSGSAAILEVALQMAKVKPTNTVRFAWWAAEELGLIGSTDYVEGLSAAERAKIALYLNFDMVGSPNFARFVYDGDGSTFGLVGPPGSTEIEALFNRFYADRGLTFEATAFDGRSDYLAFINNDIPAGGLFTGAEGIKSAAQASRYGGEAGRAFDPCYHQACDTFANNSNTVLDQNSDAIAYATLQYAMNTASINAVRGKGNFKKVPPASDAALVS
jgi:Zn-dependent M28 family amino/carboxypeptidase